MSKEYKSRAKIINKITQNGLIEKNVSTGEETNISKKTENIDLRRNLNQKANAIKTHKHSFPERQKKQNRVPKERTEEVINPIQKGNNYHKRFSKKNSKIQPETNEKNTVSESREKPSEYYSSESEFIPTYIDPDEMSPIIAQLPLLFDKSDSISESVGTSKEEKPYSKASTKKYSFKSEKIVPLTTKNPSSLLIDKTFLHYDKSSIISESIETAKKKKLYYKTGTKKYYLKSKSPLPISTSVLPTPAPLSSTDTASLHLDESSSVLEIAYTAKEEEKPHFKTNKDKFSLESKTHLELEKSYQALETESTADKKTETGFTFKTSKLIDKTEKETKTKEVKAKEIKAKEVKAKEKEQSTQLQFSKDEKTPDELKTDKKLRKLQQDSENANKKLLKAREKLPQNRKIKLVFDKSEKEPKLKLKIEKEEIPQGTVKSVSAPTTLIKVGARTVKREVVQKFHSKINEVEHENVGVHATHKTEQIAEGVIRNQRITNKVYRFVKDRPYCKVSKLQEKTMNADRKLSYQKVLNENPQLKSNPMSRMAQKRKIKKQYAKAAYDARKKVKTTKKATSLAVKATKSVVAVFSKSPVAIVVVLVILLFLCITTLLMSTFSTVMTGGIAPILASSYTASETDIDKTELIYTEWETELLMQAQNTANTHRGYDEYRYNFGEISHNPFELMAFMTVKYQGFTFDEIEADLRELFEEQYQITYTESTETRYDAYSGEPYDWYILTVSIKTKSFTDIILSRLNQEEKELFNLYQQTKGNRQYVSSPFPFNWLSKVSSPYGWRVHPITGTKDYHKGIDIAVPIGTDICSGIDGQVREASYHSSYGYYIVVESEQGTQVKYAHCDTLLASVGQTVKKGDVIAKSGNTGNSTGPHLHMEILKNGDYFNPIFFSNTNDVSTEPVYGVPSSPMGDGSFEALITEAERYLGYPYVWGGSNPSTSFDCSGFVYWVLNQSGVADIGRTTAQGYYNYCIPVSPSDAQPGDLIFFTGTYSTTNVVTHIGIYVGNGQMIHCGDPISYANINASYWQNHFYSFARLP